jgi:hypothetical protein
VSLVVNLFFTTKDTKFTTKVTMGLVVNSNYHSIHERYYQTYSQ